MKNIFILLIILLVLVLAHELYVLYVAKKVGSEVVSKSSAYTQSPENSTSKILFLGDSLAFGVGASDPKDSLSGRMGQDYPAAKIDNFAQSGRKVSGQLEQLLRKDIGQYDQIILQIGGNDVMYLSSVEEVKNDIEKVLVETKKIAPEVIFLWYGDVGLAPGLPNSFSWIHHRRSMKLREIFINAAEKNGVKYVDLYEGPGKDAFGENVEKYYSADKIHPSGEGYGLWYEKLREVVGE